MKKQSGKKISLKKFTISRITPDAMQEVRGGDCLPTEHFESDVWCREDVDS